MSIESLGPIGGREWAFIRAQLNYLSDLPAPGGEWTVSEAPPGVDARINHLTSRGFIQTEGRVTRFPTTYRYTTNPPEYEAIQAERECCDLLPCGHTGIKNHGDGEYGCGYEDCDALHARADVEEVLRL